MNALGMPTDYSYICRELHNFPPTYKEGARKVIITRDIYYSDGRVCYKKGTKGVVIPVPDVVMVALFRDIKRFLYDYEWFKKLNYRDCRTDRAYDFFPFQKMRNTGKIELSTWHDGISRFDFAYLENKQLSFFKNET